MKGLTTAVLLTAALAATTATAQGLGDAAAREKKRRSDSGASAQTAGPATKTVTTDDLEKYKSSDPPSVPAVPPSAAEPESPANGASTSPAVAPVDSNAGESGKRRQAAEMKARLDQLDAEIEKAKAELASAEEWARNARRHVSTDADRATVRRAGEFERARLESLRAQRSAIEDAARRASIPPGWLR